MNKSELFLKLRDENKIYEHESSKIICNKYGVTTTNFNDDYKYDFKTSDGLTYEVKADKSSLKYPNFFIEFLQNDKASGIETTQADYYIITNTKQYYLISVDDIKSIIKDQLINNEFSIKGFTSSVGGTTSGYAIKQHIIIDKSILI